MSPIHNSDLPEERFKDAEWQHYELWEKIELRLKKRKRLWIALTALVFMILSAVPILQDRKPRWRAYRAARILAQEIIQMKRDAALEGRAFRIRVGDSDGIRFEVEKLDHCGASSAEKIREGRLLPLSDKDHFVLLQSDQGKEMGIPGIIRDFCYEAQGVADLSRAFAILPEADVSERRLDRMVVLILSGTSAEISYD